MNEMTYGRLEEILLSLGFTSLGVEERNRVFRHDATGALILYPDFPATDAVLPRHLVLVRSVLEAYGIPAEAALFREPQKAS